MDSKAKAPTVVITNGESTAVPGLHRELGLFDLTLMLVIAVVNINTIPIIATNGWRAITLWGCTFILFLVPLALAVSVFGKLYPQEGGIYLWTKEMFGDFHAFISGWCYWTNNLTYFPSVLFILIGVLVYVAGPEHVAKAADKKFMAIGSLSALWFITLLHIRGLGFGKWLNNIGAIGTWVGLFMLMVIGILVYRHLGSAATPLNPQSFLVTFSDYPSFSAFSVALYSVVGLELGSVMGDEIKNSSKIMGRAVFLAGAICISLYLIGTSSLLIAVPAGQIRPIQGLMQAVTAVPSQVNIAPIIPVLSIFFSLAVMGVCSAWIAGAARVPFVMGVDVYLPAVLGKTHPKWKTPYVALLVQGVISSIFIYISMLGQSVNDAYAFLLKSSVVIQLIPFLYLFIGLFRLKRNRIAAILGTIGTVFGIVFVFIPSPDTTDKVLFEEQIIGSTVIMLGIALVFYGLAKRKSR